LAVNFYLHHLGSPQGTMESCENLQWYRSGAAAGLQPLNLAAQTTLFRVILNPFQSFLAVTALAPVTGWADVSRSKPFVNSFAKGRVKTRQAIPRLK
jgi:hypothetical protein